MAKTLLAPTVEVEKMNDKVWDVFAVLNHPGPYQRKSIGQFCMDVDGDWLLFINGSGGWNRHTIAELSAAFARFIPNTYPLEEE